ncbi:ANKRD6 [Mytilus edulis]|uniref:ANKRD6 n=1 Tax=Mytilus edulis TaxID=6550 RepID=A0A8S3U5Q3_MYTED|nr:ANKRD6 [Mytilus edulis]
MAKINGSRITVSANIILTASLITRTLTFGFIFMSIYIKVKDDILDEEVIKIIDLEVIAGMPLGTTIKSIVFSLIGVFVVELITGIVGLYGAFRREKLMLVVAVVLSSFMICVYIIYIVLLSIIYHKKTELYNTLLDYTKAYESGNNYLSYWNRVETFPEFLTKLGCQNSSPERHYCWSLYVQELGSYLEIYIGIIVTCMVCQICSIVAAEYIFRKLEFKEKKPSISENKYYLLLSLKHGILRNLIIFIKDNWSRCGKKLTSIRGVIEQEVQNLYNRSNSRQLYYNGGKDDNKLLRYMFDSKLRERYGDTALHTAARYGHAGVTRILISDRCRLNEQNKNGDTALHISSALKRKKIAKLLVEAGIDVYIVNKQEETAIDVAKRKDHPEVIITITSLLKTKAQIHPSPKMVNFSEIPVDIDGPVVVPDEDLPVQKPEKTEKGSKFFSFLKKKKKVNKCKTKCI